MLNGKFYAGLPPGMIERRNASTQQNRMQSSIFWPDDTKVDSALETRVKRRNSLQIAQAERPQLRMQSSVSGGGDADVNTRQLFQKEFSKSSIEFLDNLCDETKARKPLLLRGNRSASREVTPKPTALNLPLPENVVNDGYTTAKKKQAFTSKIEFYDYTGADELNNRRNNNLVRAKMDMNDKKEMERNTKNSPKLQVKNNVRSLTGEEKLYAAEIQKGGEHEREDTGKLRNNVERKHTNNVPEREEERVIDADMSAGSKQLGRDEHLRDLDYLESRRTVSPEYGYRREQRLREVYEDDYKIPDDYATSRRYVAPVRRANSVGRFTSPPKRILKHTIRERRYNEDYPNDGYRSAEPSRVHERFRERTNELYDDRAYNDATNDDVDYMEGRMRNIRIRTSPQKHVTYSDDTYSHDEGEIPNRTTTRRGLPATAQSRNRAPPPNMRQTGSNQQRQQPQKQQHQQQLRRYDSEMDLVEDVNNELLDQSFMENDIDDSEIQTTTTNKSLNIVNNSSYNNKARNTSQRAVDEEQELSNNLFNKKINSNNNNNNKNMHTSRLNNQTIASAARKITPKITTIKQNTDTTASIETMGGASGMRKHLRSSLCFNNGEIVASDDGGETSTTKPAPTRNARSMATRQRISVGLPD